MKQYMETRIIDCNLIYPINIHWLRKDAKGTKSIRKIMTKIPTEQTIGQLKWSDELALNKDMDWKKLYLIPTHCNVSARIRYFQYQILQRTLLTNRKLWLFKLIDSENCDNCEKTITHLLIDCNHLRVIWTGVENWLNHNINEKMAFDKKAILLGCPDNSILVNYIFLIVKHEIYKSKWNKSKVTLQKI